MLASDMLLLAGIVLGFGPDTVVLAHKLFQ